MFEQGIFMAKLSATLDGREGLEKENERDTKKTGNAGNKLLS